MDVCNAFQEFRPPTFLDGRLVLSSKMSGPPPTEKETENSTEIDKTDESSIIPAKITPSDSGTAAGVLISLASGVTEPPSPPPVLPVPALPPVLRSIVNKETVALPDSTIPPPEAAGVPNRVSKDFLKLAHPHALSKELVFEILTSGASAPEAPCHNSASPIDRRINFFYVTSAKSPGSLGVEDSENEISVSFQSIANSGPWWSQYTHDGKRFGIVTRHMSRRSRVQGRTGLHILGGQSGRGGDSRCQDELHGFQGRWFCLVSAPSHLIGDKPTKMKMAKAVPGALSLVQIWTASNNDIMNSRRGKRKRLPDQMRQGFPHQPNPYGGWPGMMPMPVDVDSAGRFHRPNFDPRQVDQSENVGNTWRSRIQTYSKALTDEDVFSDHDGEENESDEELVNSSAPSYHQNSTSMTHTRPQGLMGGGRQNFPTGSGSRNNWNQLPQYQQQMFDSMRALPTSNGYMPGMNPGASPRWPNPFQRNMDQMGNVYPQYNQPAAGPSYDQRFMGAGSQAEVVVGLQCQVQSLMRAVTALQSQLSAQNNGQQQRQQQQQRTMLAEEHQNDNRGTNIQPAVSKSPERWNPPTTINSIHAQDIAPITGTNGNAGSFDMFSSNNFSNPMLLPAYGARYPTISAMNTSLERATQPFPDAPMPFSPGLNVPGDSTRSKQPESEEQRPFYSSQSSQEQGSRIGGNVSTEEVNTKL